MIRFLRRLGFAGRLRFRIAHSRLVFTAPRDLAWHSYPLQRRVCQEEMPPIRRLDAVVGRVMALQTRHREIEPSHRPN